MFLPGLGTSTLSKIAKDKVEQFLFAFLLILVCMLFAAASFGQAKQDSLKIRLDQLEFRVDSLEQALENANSNMVSVSDLQSIFTSIDEDQQEFTDEDRRSKRKALDSLFNAVTRKPGQLSISGQMLNAFHWDGRSENSINTLVSHVDLFAISSFTKNGLAFINLQGVLGDGPDKYFNSFHSFHAGAGDFQSADGLDRINILEAWLEYKFGVLTVTAGKIDLTNYFDPNSVANDEYTQFLSGGFVNSTALAVPANSPGLLFGTRLFKSISLRFGISSIDNSGDKIFENLFPIVQIDKAFFIRDEEVGAIRMYAYNNGFSSDQWGFGSSFDIRLIKNFYAYGRYGLNQDSLASEFGVQSAYSLGLQLRNIRVVQNLRFIIGGAFGRSTPETERPDSTEEQAIEAYVKLRVKNFLHLSPHIQWIKNGAGQGDQELTMYGLRMLVLF